MKKDFKKKVLKNGMTIIFEKRDLPIVSVAFAVRAGGINETEDEKGISHFIEHMLYKGTPTRNSKKIAEEIEWNGGELNGFTSEEIVAYWCKMPSKHLDIALEVLRKLLNDEIKTRTKRNLVQSKTLMEMLENSIKKYHNKILTAAEVIEELIKLGKEIQNMDKEPAEMGLSEFEYAFYTAVANNESARELMKKDKLRELSIVLFERVKQKASIDWTIKESVKAKLKVIVKRTLRQFGYPPDMQKLATETVLRQAELIADELVNN